MEKCFCVWLFVCICCNGTHAQQAFRTEPRNLTVRMGATAVLKCEVLRASGIVQWAKDGLLLGPQRSLPGFPRYSMIGKRGQYHLRIENAQLEDDAFFECQAGQSESSDGIVSGLAFLTIFLSYCYLFLSLPLLTDPPDPPYIIGLDRDEVKAGTLLVLECVSHGGNPLANLQWTKVNPLHHLLNELTLSGSPKAVEGQELTLSCHASSSNPPVHIRWWLGYKELNNTSVAFEENGGMTTTSNVTHRVSREENGLRLTCEAFNNGTQFSKIQAATLLCENLCKNVHPLRTDPPQRVFIDSPPEDVPLRSGTRVLLTCFSTGGNPPAELTWFKVLTSKVSHAQPQTLSQMFVSRGLNLLLTASDNRADYRCDATNKAKKTMSAHVKLLVHFVAVSMKITAKQEVLRRGQEINLECLSGSSNPKSDVSWKVGRMRFALTNQLPGVEEKPMKSLFGGVSVLSRLSLNLSSQHNNQKVICQAYSPVLEEAANTFYHLNVLYPPEFSPEQPTEVQVVEDDVATIPLMVSANPEVFSCIWLHREDIRHQWSDDHSLEIRNVTRKDGGLYTIKCENDEGVDQTTVELDRVPPTQRSKDPVFVNLGGTADLICVADANPIIPGMFSWKWLMGEETQEDESSLLTIYNVTRAHAGFYQCTASNGIALPASVEMQLVVQFTPVLRKGPQWSKVASRGDGTTTAELVCQAEGIPRVEFIWGKKGMLIDLANPRYEERTEREGSIHTSTLRVVNVSAVLDYAVFSCTARNSLGEDKLDIQLVSTNHPDPPSLFRQVGVTHDSVTLEWIPGFNGGLQQRFRIRYIWDKAISFMYVDVLPPDETTFTVTGLQPLTTYNFSVNALNAIGESGYADNGAVLTITTKAPSGVPTRLTVAFTVVFGVLLLLNSLGCFLGRKWKNRRDKTSTRDYLFICGWGSVPSSLSNKYESREKINTGAQRTLLIDSGSETESNVYESYTAVRRRKEYVARRKRATDNMQRHQETDEERKEIRQKVKRSGSGGNYLHLDLYQANHFFTVLYAINCSLDIIFSSQGIKKAGQLMDDQQARRDYDLPFELRGELV
uniref:NPHS1 adhesion molecule, nephrin n=1 Tax=Fundulus heteroclitus TaxID=8078 RepID=A0A3Q2UDL6_FUNHE